MNAKSSFLVYGSLTGLSMIVVGSLIIVTGLEFNPLIPYLVYLPFLGGMILNGIKYSKANEGFVTFGNIFGNCFLAVLIVLAIRLAWVPVSNAIFPQVKAEIFARIDSKVSESPGIDQGQVDQGLEIVKKYWVVWMVVGQMFTTLISGVIFSLIGAAIPDKKGPRPFMRGDHF